MTAVSQTRHLGCHGASRRSAFTLVELLVASLVGLVVASMAALALHAGFAAWGRLAAGDREALEAARLLAQLERDVASAVATGDNPFDGASDRLSTVRLRPAADPASPALPVRVAWRFDPGTQTLVREERPLAAADAPPPLRLSFAPVRSLRLEYCPPGTATTEGPLVWEDAWGLPARSNLPMAVRVSLGGIDRTMPCALHAAAARGEATSGATAAARRSGGSR